MGEAIENVSTKIPFKVSARTARLIGRENIATSKGAIIELVKNDRGASDNKDHMQIAVPMCPTICLERIRSGSARYESRPHPQH